MNACVKTGALVHMVPHGILFAADLFEVAGAMVVRANGPLRRDSNCWAFIEGQSLPTHELHDDRGTGFWREDLGVFVVRKDLLKEIFDGN